MESTIKQRIKQFCNEIGISVKAFEEHSNLSNGYVNGISKSIGDEKLKTISLSFPQLNITWLLTGEGEMLRNSQSVGDISNSNVSGVNVSGNGIQINPDAYDTLLKIVETNQKATEKFQEQIDRLITIIEKKL